MIKVEFLPSEETFLEVEDDSELALTWSAEKVESDKIVLKLEFANPLLISGGSEGMDTISIQVQPAMFTPED